MNVRFSRLASAEVEEAHDWYDSHEAGLGESFRSELSAVVETIGSNPKLYAVAFGAMRRAVLKQFPYFLLYEVTADAVVVYGVVHCARDPAFWLARGNA